MASSHSLIFLHGWGTDPSVWKKQVEYFSKRYKVEIPELYSLMSCPRKRASKNAFYMDSRLRGNDSDSPILIGWSYGGMLAVEAAAKWPERFRALVLIGCSARFTDGINPVAIRNIRRNLERNFEATMRNCYGAFFSDEEAVFIDEFIRQQALPDRGPTIEILDRLAVMNLKSVLKDITVPALIIHGDKDNICPLKGGQYLAENLVNSRLEIIEGAGHMPFYTRPNEFNIIMEAFLSKLPSLRGGPLFTIWPVPAKAGKQSLLEIASGLPRKAGRALATFGIASLSLVKLAAARNDGVKWNLKIPLPSIVKR